MTENKSMRRLERRLTIVTLVAAPLLTGWMVADRLTLQPESRLWVDGTSTVRDFTCTAGAMEADVATNGSNAAAALSAGEKAITSVAFRVPAARLDCRNGQMNEHMRKALKADANPTIAFELVSYDVLDAAGTTRAKLAGTLSLGGVTKPVSIDVDLVKEGAAGLRVKGGYDLRMTEFGLKPPSLMMGTMKVHEMVKVNFDLVLKN
jgi:polyisoprenoid-binding protein YceI